MTVSEGVTIDERLDVDALDILLTVQPSHIDFEIEVNEEGLPTNLPNIAVGGEKGTSDEEEEMLESKRVEQLAK